MSFRTFALASASALLLAACSDQQLPTGVSAKPIRANRAIDAAAFCNGATMPVVECEALVDIYNGTNGSEWTNHSWGVNPNPCNWTSVACSDGDHGSVVELDLHLTNLSGPFPLAVLDLLQIRVLRLDQNALTGTIPAALADLTQLEVLMLMGNGLTGSIPSALGSLVNLKQLWLGGSNLTGQIPPELGNLSELETLHLAGAQLTGSIPASLGNLTKLNRLTLGANQLTGTIPASLGNLTSADTIELGTNQLTGSIPASIGNIVGLQWFGARSNALTGPIPATFGNLVNMRSLIMYGNALSGPIPPGLGNMTQLTTLWLNDNALTGPIPESFGNLTSMEHLYLHENALTGGIPESLAQLGNLFGVLLRDNQLSGVVPLAVATVFESAVGCNFTPGNAELYVPDVPSYRAADVDGDGTICDLPFASAEDIGEDAVDDIDDLVPDVLNEGQANALKTKIQNAMEKAAKGQFAAAINQMEAFLNQINDMVGNGTLTPAQAAPFIQQAEWLIAIWTGML